MHQLVELLSEYSHLVELEADFINLPGEESTEKLLLEGRVRSVSVNIYERNREARSKCIKKYGYSCAVCSFDFSETYGSLGEGFIHVHHLKEISTVDSEYVIDPIEDLRPVCPNCHAMLHRSKPANSINDLNKIIAKQSNKNR